MSSQDIIAPFIRRLQRRTLLASAELSALMAMDGTVREVPAHRDFVAPGQHLSQACLIVEGLVGRFGQARDGSRQISALYIAGDMPDLHSAVLPKARAALHALTPTRILQVPHAQIADLVGRFPGIAEAFWRDCTVDADIATQWLFSIGRRNARASVAHLLCEMAWRYATAGLKPDGRFDFPITQGHLADAIGMTSVHVNRMLRDLRNDGLVTIRGQAVVIHDLPALARVAEFDPAYLWLDIAPLRLTPFLQ